MSYNNIYGKDGEDKAVRFLVDNNCEIIQRNYRYKRSGEIDIIAKKDNLILFVEVKKRSSANHGGAIYSISGKKKRSLRYVANQFINSNESFCSGDLTYRFDLIAIENGMIEWIEDIIR